MSRCNTGTCPHERGVFIWLADGPWRGEPADPDYGRYPWVHNTTMIPGHLTVCELMPFATAIEAGEAPMTTGRWNYRSGEPADRSRPGSSFVQTGARRAVVPV